MYTFCGNTVNKYFQYLFSTNLHYLNKQQIRKRIKNSKLHHSPWPNGPAELNIKMLRKMLKWNNNPTELDRACVSLLKFWTSIQRNTRLLFRKWFFMTFQWVVKSITSGFDCARGWCLSWEAGYTSMSG